MQILFELEIFFYIFCLKCIFSRKLKDIMNEIHKSFSGFEIFFYKSRT